jgi:hypothetical protein
MSQIIITGTGHNGTRFVSKVLQSVGVGCTHEEVFHLRGWEFAREVLAKRKAHPEWGWRAESSFLAAPFLDKPEMQAMTVVHLVRRPKDVIESYVRMSLYEPVHRLYVEWMAQFIPEIWDWSTPEQRAAYWYVAVNEMIEPHADLFHRAEDDPRGLLDALGIAWQGKRLYENTRCNTKRWYGPADANLDELPEPLRGRLSEMTERYGYE